MAITKVTSSVLEDNVTIAGNLDVSSGTIKLDGNYPTGTSNVALGNAALDDGSLSGASNTAIGDAALTANTTGASNTAVGAGALTTNTTGVRNTAVGQSAGLFLTEGNDNTLIGQDAGDSITTGSSNVAVGSEALDANTTADNNTAVGYASLGANTTGHSNAAFGAYTLQSNTASNRNTAVGYNSLSSLNHTSSTNGYNSVIGFQAGSDITTGVNNTFIGALVGDATDDGGNNTAVGYGALSANCGNQNTAIGENALAVTVASTSTAVGAAAGYGVTTGANNCFFGQQAGRAGSPGGNITTASNILTLGNSSIATANIQVDWTVASDSRDKTDFTALDLGLDFVKALAPFTYKWDKRASYGDNTADDYDLAAQTPDGTHKEDWLDIGFKAQDVEALEIAAGYDKSNNTNLISSYASDGKSMGLQYSKFVPILVKAIQELSAQNAELTTRITALEG